MYKDNTNETLKGLSRKEDLKLANNNFREFITTTSNTGKAAKYNR